MNFEKQLSTQKILDQSEKKTIHFSNDFKSNKETKPVIKTSKKSNGFLVQQLEGPKNKKVLLINIFQARSRSLKSIIKFG